jgi:hypothetical protein
MALESGGAHERRHLRCVCCSSASDGDRGPEGNGGICGLPLQRGSLRTMLPMFVKSHCVRQVVSRRRDIGSAWVDCVDSEQRDLASGCWRINEMSSPDELMLQPVAMDFVSRVGSLRKTNGRCRRANCLNGGVHSRKM